MLYIIQFQSTTLGEEQQLCLLQCSHYGMLIPLTWDPISETGYIP